MRDGPGFSVVPEVGKVEQGLVGGVQTWFDGPVVPDPHEDVTTALTGQVISHRANRLADDVQVLGHPLELQGAGLLDSQLGGEFAFHSVRSLSMPCK